MSYLVQAHLYSKVPLEGMDIHQLAEAALFNLLAFERPETQAPWLLNLFRIIHRLRNSLNVPPGELSGLILYPYKNQPFNGELPITLCSPIASKDDYGAQGVVLHPRHRVISVKRFNTYIRKLDSDLYRKALMELPDREHMLLNASNDYIVFKE